MISSGWWYISHPVSSDITAINMLALFLQLQYLPSKLTFKYHILASSICVSRCGSMTIVFYSWLKHHKNRMKQEKYEKETTKNIRWYNASRSCDINIHKSENLTVSLYLLNLYVHLNFTFINIEPIRSCTVVFIHFLLFSSCVKLCWGLLTSWLASLLGLVCDRGHV